MDINVEKLGEAMNPQPQVLTIQHDGIEVPVAAVKKGEETGYQLESLKQFIDEVREHPKRRTGVARLDSLDSLIAHANRFKGDQSACFARKSRFSFGVTYDYHAAGYASAPGNLRHSSVYEMVISRQMKVWQASEAESFSQPEFAEFIEENVIDVSDPSNIHETTKAFLANMPGLALASPSALMAVSKSCKINVNSAVEQKIDPVSGETTMFFKEQHTGESGASLKVPNAFLLSIPLFELGAGYQVPVMLRYRVNGGKLTWSYKLLRVTELLDHAFKKAAETLAKETALPLFEGSRE